MFTSVLEDNASGNEAPKLTERKLRHHLEGAFNIAREMVDLSGLNVCIVPLAHRLRGR
ncbi:hypothetical protein DPMN_106559 [Dreissena polymorpha]|uniref:Uncharacterized protein n=1 Tax=Dreissena polymorpha TaxID=45954 RepID=A0A9D4K5F6_DREPO|nr:hypothetical protein DPMN_106559 [Dreissena polymorpha]